VPRTRHEYIAYVYKADIVDAVDREGPFSGHFEIHGVSAEEAIAWGRERATRVIVALDTPAVGRDRAGRVGRLRAPDKAGAGTTDSPSSQVGCTLSSS